MGKNAAKIILPVLAIGGLAAATGGFGLFGASGAGAAASGAGAGAAAGGAGAGAGAAAAGATAASAAEGAALTAGIGSAGSTGAFVSGAELASLGAPAGFAGSVAPVAGVSVAPAGGGAVMAELGMTTGGFSTAAPGMMPIGAAAAESSPGLFSSIIGKAGSGALLTYGEAAGLGVSGVGAAVNAANAAAQAKSQQDALELQRLAAELDATNREVDSQQALAKALSSQMVVLNAQGRDPSAPTPLRLASAAESEARSQILSARAGAAANAASHSLLSSQVRRSRTGAMAGSLLQLGRDGWSVFNGRSLIG